MSQVIEKTFTIKAEPRLMKRFERLLALMSLCSRWGHTGTFGMWVDGDGADRIHVEGDIDMDEYRKGVEKISGVGYHVELATDRGYGGTFIDGDRNAKWQYDDAGSTLSDA